mmetsp:Transcript_1448/g.2970  ORF Transcript_1448/g.2970 Transcript_1448/m.2970 type:complete len:413 (+) Transcript_1448:3-1241(+)
MAFARLGLVLLCFVGLTAACTKHEGDKFVVEDQLQQVHCLDAPASQFMQPFTVLKVAVVPSNASFTVSTECGSPEHGPPLVRPSVFSAHEGLCVRAGDAVTRLSVEWRLDTTGIFIVLLSSVGIALAPTLAHNALFFYAGGFCSGMFLLVLLLTVFITFRYAKFKVAVLISGIAAVGQGALGYFLSIPRGALPYAIGIMLCGGLVGFGFAYRKYDGLSRRDLQLFTWLLQLMCLVVAYNAVPRSQAVWPENYLVDPSCFLAMLAAIVVSPIFRAVARLVGVSAPESSVRRRGVVASVVAPSDAATLSDKRWTSWTVAETLAWLATATANTQLWTPKEAKDLEDLFAENHVTGPVLNTITDKDLKEDFGVVSLGQRRTLLLARDRLVEGEDEETEAKTGELRRRKGASGDHQE